MGQFSRSREARTRVTQEDLTGKEAKTPYKPGYNGKQALRREKAAQDLEELKRTETSQPLRTIGYSPRETSLSVINVRNRPFLEVPRSLPSPRGLPARSAHPATQEVYRPCYRRVHAGSVYGRLPTYGVQGGIYTGW